MRRYALAVLCLAAVLFVCSMGAAAAKETLNVIYMAQAGYQPDDIRDMADLFEFLTDTKVNITFVKYDEQHEKIIASAVAPVATYDVILLDLIWTAEFASKKMVVPLDDRITADIRKDIAPAIMDAFVYDGKTWAMPFLANFQLFFYNIDMIKKAGFAGPPKTIEEMVDQMKAMKAKGIVIYTVGFNISSNSSPAVTMRNCATDLSKYFQPATGEELVEDFAEIGQDITELRLSQ